MSLKNKHEVYYLNKKELEEQKNISEYMSNGAVIIYPEKFLFNSRLVALADHYYDFQFRPGDVIVEGFMRSGTTWTQEIIWQMTHNPSGNNPESETEIYFRSPYLEHDAFFDPEFIKHDQAYFELLQTMYPNLPCDEENFLYLDLAKELPDRRIIKSHLPPTLMNPDLLDIAKVVYVLRDPKDVCLSAYYYYKNIKGMGFKGTLEEFGDVFLEGKCIIGELANHLRQWHPYIGHKNLVFIFYEDLKNYTMNELKKLNHFLGTNLTEAQLQIVEHRTSFKEMKKQESILNAVEGKESDCYICKKEAAETGGFFRKGVIGDSKEKFSAALHQKFDEHFREAFKGLNLPYNY